MLTLGAAPDRGAGIPVRYIRSHAALRGVAALLVVAYHLQFGVPYRLHLETATPFFDRGYLFVDLFFMLSGFVISLTSDADRRRPFGRGEVRAFYVARLARIYPLHLVCLIAIVASLLLLALARYWHNGAAPSFSPGAARSFVAELLLVQAWIPGAPYWNVPSWSISAELAAYLFFPVLMAGRARWPRVTTILCALGPLGFYLWIAWSSGSLDVITGAAIPRCLSGFLVGVLLYDARRAAARWPGAALAAGQIAAVAAIVAVLAVRCPDPLVIPAFALLVVTTWQDRGPAAAALIHPWAERAGTLSYSIYLTHTGLIAIILPLWYAAVSRLGLAPAPARVAFIVACLGATLLVSGWTFVHVEQAGRARLRRLMAEDRG